jgi:hypothetical protein
MDGDRPRGVGLAERTRVSGGLSGPHSSSAKFWRANEQPYARPLVPGNSFCLANYLSAGHQFHVKLLTLCLALERGVTRSTHRRASGRAHPLGEFSPAVLALAGAGGDRLPVSY